jgi:anti-sigma factor RsiW
MADPLRHVDAMLVDAVDGRLAGAEREAFEAHVAECERCRSAYRALAWAKREMAPIRAEPVPEGLEQRLHALLDAEDRAAPAVRGLPARRPMSWRPRGVTAGLLAAAAILLVAVAVWWTRPVPLPDAIARDLRGVRSGSLALTFESGQIAAAEDHLAGRLGFRTPVYDLSAMDYRVIGVRANRLEGRPSALSAYRGADGRWLICEMFRGTLDDLPAPDERRRRGDVQFLVYRRAELTVVFWQSGPIVCALAGEADPDLIFRMAVAKAGAPPA